MRLPAAVKRAASRFRISLRRPGSRRGSVLGQPRGVSLRPAVRADVASGRVDPEVLAARMRLDADAGLCRICHLHELAEAHREALEAQRELWTTRQQLKRARGCAGGEEGSST